MKEIEISQFQNIKQFIEYFDHTLGSTFSPYFFDDNTLLDVVITNMKDKNIRVFEGKYLLPQSDDNKLTLSPAHLKVLDKYRSNGPSIRAVRETVLMFLNPNYTNLTLHLGNILIDSISRSAIFTGALTASKLFDFILSPLFDDIDSIYAFPYQHRNYKINSPFEEETYLKFIVTSEVKQRYRKTHDNILMAYIESSSF